jgi:ABC-type phosphate transport system permease subunit
MNTNLETTGGQTPSNSIIDKLLNIAIDKLKASDVSQILEVRIVDPVTEMIEKKVRPYLWYGALMYLIIIVMLIFIIIMLMRQREILIKNRLF